MNTSTIVAFGKWRKLFVEEITVGTVKTTYIGTARYRSEVDHEQYAFMSAADTAKAIWNISKLVEDTSIGGTKTTEQWSPVWTDKFDQVRDNRATIIYL